MRACCALMIVLLTSAVGFGYENAGPKMVEVPGGSFTMGSATELSAPIASNQPAHTVTVSDFLMSKYEVTNQEFADYLNDAEASGEIEVRDDLPGTAGEFVVATDGQTYAGQKLYELSGTNQDGESEINRPWIQYDDGAANGKRFAVVDSQDVFGNSDATDTADWPATFVKWHGAAAFAMFNDAQLPSEAQWEYASQGGAGLPYGTDDGTLSLDNANYSGQATPGEIDAAAPGHAVAVGSYPANPFGLYDLAGNVWEWTEDFYDPDFYTSSDGDIDPLSTSGIDGSGTDPAESDGCSGGPSTVYTCNTRLKRGGSWNFHEPTLRSESRNTDYVFRGNDHFGFRIVQSASKPDRPLKLQATVKSSSRIRLDWQDQSDNESAFEVQYKKVPGKWQSMETGANVDNLTIGDLSAGTSHKFRVRARNASGTSRWSNRVRAKTNS